MEHPKDVGDRSTLAIISVLVPIGHLPVLHRGALRVDPPKNNQLDRIRFAADYEVGRVAIEGLRVSSGA